ncbi:hypothetical protein GKZ68_09950 [Hymenobacter sp. BRD128]|uniref:hypothetical protein n=1 Tax=Hymenobacter sp. BRD128 TaxID=2675878 RepID=UPI0015632C79|nr:hypothetical protein [Hymenobacter sp. BRD128]QKG56922.1 hypothetical protein GKZ68_09950 [Hymenobacter sp. BRD128]
MKTSSIFAVALLGLGLSFSAHAQTPAVGTPSAMPTPGSPATPAVGTIAPGPPSTIMPGTASPGATVPVGASRTTMYPNGVPARNADAGTLRSDQPLGSPATSGSQPTRRLNTRTRPGTSTNTTTTRP